MKCSDVQQFFTLYWDVDPHDLRRLAADEHMKHCAVCRQEFELWEESMLLIQSLKEEAEPPADVQPAATAARVMDRIYAGESWKIPVSERIYHITYKFRRNIAAMIAFCLALFAFSFLYSLVYEPGEGKGEPVRFGLQPVASASEGAGASISSSKMVASLYPQDPFLLKVGPIQTYPDYLLALSLLGLVCTLLIMNWFSRTKS